MGAAAVVRGGSRTARRSTGGTAVRRPSARRVVAGEAGDIAPLAYAGKSRKKGGWGGGPAATPLESSERQDFGGVVGTPQGAPAGGGGPSRGPLRRGGGNHALAATVWPLWTLAAVGRGFPLTEQDSLSVALRLDHHGPPPGACGRGTTCSERRAAQGEGPRPQQQQTIMEMISLMTTQDASRSGGTVATAGAAAVTGCEG